MALTTATITGDLADLLGVDFDVKGTKLWISTNVANNTLIDTAGKQIRLGSGNITINGDGTFTADVWVPGPDGNPTSWQTSFHVDYRDRNAPGGRSRRTFGPYTITASADLAELEDEQAVPAAYLTTVTQQLDAKVAEAEAAAQQAKGIDEATATALAPGATPTVSVTGSSPNRVLEIGIPGAVADDASMAAQVGTGGAFDTALSASFGGYGIVRLEQFIPPASRGAAVAGTFAVDTAFADALAALPTVTDPQDHQGGHKRGIIILPAGQLRVDAPLPNVGPYVSVIGQGKWATILMFFGTGSCFRDYSPHYPSSGFLGFMTLDWAGNLRDFCIDGTNAGAGSVGLHYGDLEGGDIDIVVQNFDKAGSIGYLFENTVWWTEKTYGRLVSKNNATAARFSVGGDVTSTNSFGYNQLDFVVLATAGQNGFVFDDGVQYYHGSLRARGNFQRSSESTDGLAVLTVQGEVPAGHPGALQGTAITDSFLDVQVEAQGSGNAPKTIIYGETGGGIYAQGILSFNYGFEPTNLSPGESNKFKFSGIISGDTVLNPSNNSSFIALGGLQSNLGKLWPDGTLVHASGEMFSQTLTKNMVVAFQNVLQGATRRTVRITQAASGGPYTVTWPTSVKWPGGTAPVMTATAGATDIYELTSLDGVTFYGRAIQNVS